MEDIITLKKEIEFLKFENEKLKELCRKDHLTGLLNRKVLDEFKEDLCVKYIMIDIDDFKIINDTYGHLVGDNIIKIVAKCLLESFRKTDKIIRYGGDEFCVIFKIEESLNVIVIEKRMKEFLDMFDNKLQNEKIRVSVSYGIGNTLKEADDFLYKSKRNRRRIDKE